MPIIMPRNQIEAWRIESNSAGLVEDIEFTITTKLIVGQTCEQDGVFGRDKRGDWGGGNFRISITYSLIGKILMNYQYANLCLGLLLMRGIAIIILLPVSQFLKPQSPKKLMINIGKLM